MSRRTLRLIATLCAMTAIVASCGGGLTDEDRALLADARTALTSTTTTATSTTTTSATTTTSVQVTTIAPTTTISTTTMVASPTTDIDGRLLYDDWGATYLPTFEAFLQILQDIPSAGGGLRSCIYATQRFDAIYDDMTEAIRQAPEALASELAGMYFGFSVGYRACELAGGPYDAILPALEKGAEHLVRASEIVLTERD